MAIFIPYPTSTWRPEDWYWCLRLIWVMMSNSDVDTFPLVSWVRCGAWLYRFLIFALFLTMIWKLLSQNLIIHFYFISDKFTLYSKTCVKQPLSKRPIIGFQDQSSLNAGQKYCRMLQGEHSAILSTFIKLPFVIEIFVLSIFEWPFLLYPEFIIFTCS